MGDIFDICDNGTTFMFMSVFIKENRPFVAYIPDIDNITRQQESMSIHAKDIIKYRELDADGMKFWLSLNRCERYASDTITSLKIFAARVFF
jgi:hypothetical protein